MIYVLVEWAWTLIAAVGLVASGWLYLQAREDVQWLLANAYNGRRLIVARGHERREALRAIVQALGLYVGCYAISLPNPPGARLNIGTLALMLMQFFVVLNTVFDHLDRNKLRAYWENVDRSHVAERDKNLGT